MENIYTGIAIESRARNRNCCFTRFLIFEPLKSGYNSNGAALAVGVATAVVLRQWLTTTSSRSLLYGVRVLRYYQK